MSTAYQEFRDNVRRLFVKPDDIGGKIGHSALGICSEWFELFESIIDLYNNVEEEIGDFAFFAEGLAMQFGSTLGLENARARRTMSFGGVITEPFSILIASRGAMNRISSACKARWIYGREVEHVGSMFTELGTFIASLCKACGLSVEQVLEANIAKLRKRYPQGYSDQAANERADKA